MDLRPGTGSYFCANVKAYSLIEILLAVVILAVVLYALLGLLSGGYRLGHMEMEILGLQADAQRSVVRFLKELQEAMVVILPQPGHTLPYAVVRDKLNRVAYYTLVPEPGGKTCSLRRDLTNRLNEVQSALLMKGIRRMTFSALSDGAVRIHMIISSNTRDYAFYTQIRLRNREAASL